MKKIIEVEYEINNDLQINPMLDAVYWSFLVLDFNFK